MKLCSATLGCLNCVAVEIGGEQLCVTHAAEKDLRALLSMKTKEELQKLAAIGCGGLPPWARFGVPRGWRIGDGDSESELKRGRGRPREWLSGESYRLAQRWRRLWSRGVTDIKHKVFPDAPDAEPKKLAEPEPMIMPQPNIDAATDAKVQASRTRKSDDPRRFASPPYGSAPKRPMPGPRNQLEAAIIETKRRIEELERRR